MSFKKKLWLVRITVVAERADLLASLFNETSLAVTVLAPPRQRSAKIEVLYDTPPDEAALTAQLAIAALLHKIKTPTFIVQEVPKLDWLKKVAADFPPLSIARWTVHGAHYRHAVPDRRSALQIDATNAFGTGEHPTTRGCLTMLEALFKNKKRRSIGSKKQTPYLLDMGCGSGILALAYTKAHYGKAVAVDLDPDSVLIAKGNSITNGVAGRMRVGLSCGYRSSVVKKGAPYDLIMANIFARPLAHMAKDLRRHLAKGGYVILAGLLNTQANGVLAAHRLQKIYLVKRFKSGEWSILALRRRRKA
jgi:ribosomal protein L11 methyltransferase